MNLKSRIKYEALVVFRRPKEKSRTNFFSEMSSTFAYGEYNFLLFT